MDEREKKLIGELGALHRQVRQQSRERQQVEAALRESEARYRTLAEHSIQGISVVSREGVRVYANPAFATILGYDHAQELIGRSVRENIAPHEYARMEAMRQQRLRGEAAPESYVYQAVKRDGSLIWVENRASLIPWDGALAVLGIQVDITARKQAEETLAVRVQQLQTVRTVAEEITQELDLQRLLDLIVQRVVDLFGATRSSIFLWDATEQLLNLHATHGVPTARRIERFRLGQGVVGTVAQRRQGLLVDVYQDSPYAIQEAVEHMRGTSLVAEPLLYRDRLIGVITGLHLQGRPFTAADRDMLALLAAEAAIAIANARLFKESTHRQAWLSSILEINKRIALSANMPSLLARIAAEATQLVQADGTMVRVRRGDDLVATAETCHGTVILANSTLRLGEGVAGMAALEQRVILTPDIQAEPLALPAYKRQAMALGIASLVTLPICGSHGVVGTLHVTSRRPRVFNADEITALSRYAEQAAIAIEQAQLVGAVQQRQVELEQANVALRGEIAARQHAEDAIRQLNTQLEQRVVERTAQIEAANKELEAFSYSVSHDLRAPLRAVDGFARILLEDYAPRLDGEVQRYLSLVRHGTQRMGRLIDDLLTFARVSRRPLSKRLVRLDELAHQVLDDLRHEYDGRQVEVVIGRLSPCQADPVLLKQVLTNLLANALKFTRQQQVARIEVGWCETHGAAAYFVRDNGVGFDMRYAGKLFGVFQRLHRMEDYEGTGVGLALVQRIIHRHGGRVWAEAAVGRGATVYFTLGEGQAHG
jgi:PAS domain S-box-containing protein